MSEKRGENLVGPYEFPQEKVWTNDWSIWISPEISMDQWCSKFSESFSLDSYWSIKCSSLENWPQEISRIILDKVHEPWTNILFHRETLAAYQHKNAPEKLQLGKSKWGLSKWGLKVLVHNCPRLPTIVIILRRKFPLEKGTRMPQMCTIADDCAQIADSGLTHPFESPHLDFPYKFDTQNGWKNAKNLKNNPKRVRKCLSPFRAA